MNYFKDKSAKLLKKHSDAAKLRLSLGELVGLCDSVQEAVVVVGLFERWQRVQKMPGATGILGRMKADFMRGK